MLNEKKVAFFICYNDEACLEECLSYIEELKVPNGHSIEIMPLAGAQSMTSGYNQLMNASDAKYKVYLHQDVYIINENFIEDIICVFNTNDALGMLGVIGGVDIPRNAVIWNAWNRGRTIGYNGQRMLDINMPLSVNAPYEEVEAIDGMLMVTQYDIPWREDLALGWDFYDISQSMEFRRKGYIVGVPNMSDVWTVHDCGLSKIKNYDRSRRIIMDEYCEFFNDDYCQIYNPELFVLQEKLAERMKWCIVNGYMNEAGAINDKLGDMTIWDNDIFLSRFFIEIFEKEQKKGHINSFFDDVTDWTELKRKYNTIKNWLIRIENKQHTKAAQKWIQVLRDRTVSVEVLSVLLTHCTLNPNRVIDIIFVE